MESGELKMAQSEAQASRTRLEHSFDELDNKVRSTARRVKHLNDRINAPFDFLREKPLPAAVICAVVGYIVGSKIQERFGEPEHVELGPLDRRFPTTERPPATPHL